MIPSMKRVHIITTHMIPQIGDTRVIRDIVILLLYISNMSYALMLA